MVKLFSLTALLTLAVLLAGCGDLPGLTVLRGSGNLITQEEDVSDFSRVVISSTFQAEIAPGDDYRVVLTVDDNLLPYLRVEQTGDTLRIGLVEPGVGVSDANLKAQITMPRLEAVEASGASKVFLEDFQSDDPLTVNVSGASSLNGDIATGDIAVDASGASTVNLAGFGQDADLTASGASTVDMGGYSVSNAAADSSGASRIIVDVSGRLDASASGASSVHYLGNPTNVNSDTSGSSTIAPR
jgi:hypothetical protein